MLYAIQGKRDYHSRIIQHMGYHRNEQTQGLRLCLWVPDINSDITFNHPVLSPELADVHSCIEYTITQEVKPLLGKHK